MDNPIIHINDLSLTLADKRILTSVSFEIFKKDYVMIIGPNGAGKTSLLKCLMRIYPSPNNSIFIKDKPIEKISQRNLAKIISYVPQNPGSSIPFTVEEFMLMGRYPYLSPFTSFTIEDKKALQQALDLTKVTHLRHRELNTLSGGERQAVFIAAALVQEAELLLLDEPTTFLDPKHEQDVYQILSNINQELGKTIFAVTHDINNAVLNGKKIMILKDGQVNFLGKPAEVMQEHILNRVYETHFIFTAHPQTGQPIIVPGGGKS